MTTTTDRSPSGRMRQLPALLRGNGAVAVAIVVMSVATYGFQIVAARQLGPSQYGGVASLMAMLLVIGVAQLGLQATAARRISADRGQARHIEAVILQATYRVAAVLGLVLLAASPLVWRLLKLDSIAPALWLAVAAVPLAIVGGYSGVLQGERRWLPLGLVYLSLGIGRLGVGTVFILWRPTEGAAMAGVTLALFLPVGVGWWVLRGRRAPVGDALASGAHPLRQVVRETLVSSQALLAFFVLSNADIVVARNVLDSHDAGLYAGGLILTKAVLFAPQFVVVIAFPSMSTANERRRALLVSLGAVLSCGVVSILGAWLLSDVAMIFIGGDEYSDVRSKLWLFAVLGTFLATLQMLVYSVLARQGTRSVWFIWLAVVALVGGTLLTSTLDSLVLTVTVVDAILFAILLSLSLYRMQPDAPDSQTAPTPGP